MTGTPQACVKGVEEYIEAGVRLFIIGFLAPDVNARFGQMEVFAQRVMPYFRS